MTTEQRLERLERKNRWIWWLCFGPVALSLAVAALAHGVSVTVSKHLAVQETKIEELSQKVEGTGDLEVRSLTVKKLTVKDKDGEERVTLGPNTLGGLSLNLWNTDGDAHIVFATAGDGRPHLLDPWVRSLTVTDGTKRRVKLAAAAESSSSLNLYDNAGRSRATLSADWGGHSALFFVDKAGNEKFVIAVDADGIPSLGLGNKFAEGGIVLLVDRDGTASINLCDKNRRTRACLKTKADGASSLTFFDKDGNVIWKAPKD